MEIVSQLVNLLSLVVSIMLIVAILRIFSIDATLKKVLKKLCEMDQNRRDEFDAMTEAQS